MSKTVEIRVRPVTRYVVTRYTSFSASDGMPAGASCETIGEFDNKDNAEMVADALRKRAEFMQKIETTASERIEQSIEQSLAWLRRNRVTGG